MSVENFLNEHLEEHLHIYTAIELMSEANKCTHSEAAKAIEKILRQSDSVELALHDGHTFSFEMFSISLDETLADDTAYKLLDGFLLLLERVVDGDPLWSFYHPDEENYFFSYDYLEKVLQKKSILLYPSNETLLTEPTTDAELKAAYEKVVGENQTLREQIAGQQKTIDDLRRIIDENATIQQYPIELAYAVQAWKAVSINTNASKGSTIKAKLIKWIEENNKDYLAKATINRIATVANWNKEGGAPTS